MKKEIINTDDDIQKFVEDYYLALNSYSDEFFETLERIDQLLLDRDSEND